MDGRCPVDDVIKLGWPVTPSDSYDTIAGWLLDMAGSVPSLGQEFTVDGYRFHVRAMRRSRIQTIHVKRVEPPE